MGQRVDPIFFALLRSAICGAALTEAEKADFSAEQLGGLLAVAKTHDVAHLLAYALKQNGLIAEENAEIEAKLFNAVYRYEGLNYEYAQACAALEAAEIPFIPLKGSVLRKYYPEEWLRTSCDVDILVHREDLARAVSYLSKNLGYTAGERGAYDMALISPSGVHIELHFDLIGEWHAQNATAVLSGVWNNVTLRENCRYHYEMSDAFFYFYHVAHMAKHFENGGCGIRSFIDLWILDRLEGVDREARDRLLSEGGLLRFANTSRALSRAWFDGEAPDALTLQMQSFIMNGGVYGSSDNRVALWQKKKGGRVGYVFSRAFIPFAKLKCYYPILEKHPWLMPVMQVRRWFMLLNPNVAKMVRSELSVNRTLDRETAEGMDDFLDNVGL